MNFDLFYQIENLNRELDREPNHTERFQELCDLLDDLRKREREE